MNTSCSTEVSRKITFPGQEEPGRLPVLMQQGGCSITHADTR